MAGRRQFPIGEQDFANVRNRNLVYIDLGNTPLHD